MIERAHTNEEIPQSWEEGEIIRLYKGKGVKGKWSNEREITLAISVGKVLKRIIYERVKTNSTSQKRKLEAKPEAQQLITS